MTGLRAEIGSLWHATNRAAHDRMRNAFRGCDQPIGTLFLLRHVKSEPGLTISELARQTGMVKSHISKMVDQLVAKGYAEKRADKSDQRLVRIYVNEAGVESLDTMERMAKAAWAEVAEHVPDEELPGLVQGLRVLLGAIERANGKASEETPPQ